MPRFSSNRSRPALAAALLLVLASLALAACGSSSSASPSGSTASTAATATTATTGSTAPSTAATATKAATKGTAKARTRFLAVRECLQKSGVVLPRKPGQQAPGAGFLAGGAPQLPKGVTAAQYQAAIKKCGGFPSGRFGGAVNRLKSGQFRQTLAKFATCLRENGVDIPAPNTSGKGPIFNTKGVNVASAKFKAAQLKCASVLRQGLRPTPGSAPGAPPTPGG